MTSEILLTGGFRIKHINLRNLINNAKIATIDKCTPLVQIKLLGILIFSFSHKCSSNVNYMRLQVRPRKVN